jgi:nucleoside-diphosphate-sugar epimerase
VHALVTGGGGFLGRYIVEQLLARGDRVCIYSRGDYPDLAALGVEIRQGDLRDESAVLDATAGVDAVLHVAAQPGIWGPWKTYYEINTLGTQHVINACWKQGVEKLVYTSSPSVVYDGKPHLSADESLPYPTRYLCHYARSKALAEQAVLRANGERGLNTIALRPHLIWGPRDNHLVPRLIERARTGRLIRVGDGTNLISMSYVENAAAAHLQALEALRPDSACAGKAYFINEAQPVRLWDWINQLLELAGLPPVRRSISPVMAWAAGGVCEAVYTLLRMKSDPPMTRFLASQLSRTHVYSIANAQRDFRYTPIVSFAEGMHRIAPEVRQCAHRV